jgi:acetoin utilization protein AcuB
MEVSDRMTKDPITIRASETSQAAAELMRGRKIRHLPVVDVAGKLVGIVTDRDIRQILFAPAMRTRVGEGTSLMEQVTVEEIMTSPAITTTPYADLADAAKIMHERKIGALPVVERGRVVGILSEIDVLKAFYEMTGRKVEARPEDW